MENQKSFAAELASLHLMLNWVRSHLVDAGLTDVEIKRIEIALEEGIVNIISYAYQGTEGTIELGVHFEKENFIEIQIEDHGLPFNPLSHKREIDPMIPVEELEEGGLGILFMKKIMDTVEYRRDQEKNILILRKNLS